MRQDVTVSVTVCYCTPGQPFTMCGDTHGPRAGTWTKDQQELQLARTTKFAAFMGSKASKPVRHHLHASDTTGQRRVQQTFTYDERSSAEFLGVQGAVC